MPTKIINIVPMGKPRQTRSDKWKKRPCVMRSRAFSDEIRKQVGGYLEDVINMDFKAYLPIPKSWSKKKVAAMRGQPHRTKPDIDNIAKQIFDSLCKDDSGIYSSVMSKYWDDGHGPRIVLSWECK